MRRYYLKEHVNPLARCYRSWVKKEKPLPRFPRVVQIQTKSGCNAKCVFCPNSLVGDSLTHGEMDWHLFTKIADEITRHRVTRISPYLMNEPLIDKNLGDKIKYLADRKQESTVIKINSNGSMLNGDMGEQLIESGLDRINFSIHGIRKETYEAQMKGLKLEKVLENINNFLELKKRKNTDKPRIRITMVKTKAIEEELPEIMDYWGKREVKVNVRPLENRAQREIATQGINPYKWRPFSFCNRLFEQAYILYNGDVVLCCVDWERTTILGNLKEKTLEEIWNSPEYMDIRLRYLKGDLGGLLCQRCLTT
jgi:MoaA/NifB/PqqE/SkfB family radical SAM enzyme